MGQPSPQIAVKYEQNATVATLTSEKILEEQDIRALEEALMPLIAQAEIKNMVIDFSNVKFLTSSALGLLIRVNKKVRESSGNLRLCSIDPRILEIFRITRLDSVFDIQPDVESAVRSFV